MLEGGMKKGSPKSKLPNIESVNSLSWTECNVKR